MKNSGFTLIELLVAITIVAIMSTLGFMGIKGQIKKAKATRAIAAVKETSKALELYYNNNDEYPVGNATDIPTDIFQNGQVPAGVLYDGKTDGTAYCLSVDTNTIKLTDGATPMPASLVKNVKLNCKGCTNATTMNSTTTPYDNFCLLNAQ